MELVANAHYTRDKIKEMKSCAVLMYVLRNNESPLMVPVKSVHRILEFNLMPKLAIKINVHLFKRFSSMEHAKTVQLIHMLHLMDLAVCQVFAMQDRSS